MTMTWRLKSLLAASAVSVALWSAMTFVGLQLHENPPRVMMLGRTL
ncbi:hypothetical protein [Xaviernesmea oryzae]|nr:hypothetical protein [Xaviernesmea oryzae]